MNPLHQAISQLVPTLGGWCSVERAIELAQMIEEHRGGVSVSIGVWAGRDTLSMAMAHRAVGNGYVLAVDPFEASASVAGQGEADTKWWGNQAMHDQTCTRFLSDVQRLGLSDWVRFERTRSDDATVPSAISVLTVDGNHSDQAVKDVERWAPKVIVGGFVYMDDIGWSGGGVKRAVERLLAMGFDRLHDRDTGAFFKRGA